MARLITSISTTAILAAASAAVAQPQITSLGTGTPASVSNPVSGTNYITGTSSSSIARWTLSGGTLTLDNLGGTGSGVTSADGSLVAGAVLNVSPQASGNAATGVSPPFSTTPTLVPTLIAATESAGARWDSTSMTWQRLGSLPIDPSLMVYGSGSSGSSSGNFLITTAMSPNGRFIVGRGYISTYNSAAGTTIAVSSSQWRPFIWDAQANGGNGGLTVLPTPFRTSSNTYRRRTGVAYAVSNDGLVIAGTQEHNVSAAAAPDPDGARPAVWRWNPGTSSYDMTYLPNGVNSSGFPYTYSISSGMLMNSDGTVVVCRAVADLTGNSYVAKWTWNSGTSSWSAPVVIGADLTTPASWLPLSVTSCGIPPTLTPTGMSDDGNTVVGMAVYSTCGSFMSGGFIWTQSSGLVVDWYDHLVAQNVPGITANYGPIGDNGDPARGLPKLGFPAAISPDGSTIVGFQGGNQLIPGAAPWALRSSGAPGCVAPAVVSNPNALTTFSRCSSFGVILNAAASGSSPAFAWFKDNVELADGPTASGSVLSGVNTGQLRITGPNLGDAGNYHCVVSNACGSVQTTTAVVQPDPSVTTPPNDTCANATSVGEGTFAFNPCGAWVDEAGAICNLSIGPGTSDVWYSYTPTFTGEARFQTCGANYNTVIGIWSECGGVELACNDDVGSGVSGCSSNRSRISRYNVTAGVPVLIRVAASTSPGTTGSLQILQAPPIPANDDCSNPTPVTVAPGNLPVTTTFDCAEASDDWLASCVTASSYRDLWFTFNPPQNGTVRLATCPGTSFDTVLSVHSACLTGDYACNDNAGISGCSTQSIIDSLAVTRNTPLLIRIAQKSLSTTTAGTLTLKFTPACPADYDNDGVFTPTDIASFINTWFNSISAGGLAGDYDGNGVVDPTDIATFINAWLTGVQSGC
ncbi:MAG: hypothetical protein KF745_04695 [Phycisphaeraceae bacterium]|nr:hypothetical protein [Phycisphaeraceae bacterium]